MNIHRVLFTICLLFAASALQAQDASNWHLVSTQNISDFDSGLDATLSTDGQKIAWTVSGEICIFVIDSTETTCYALPEQFAGRPSSLVWAWQSDMIAFTEDPFRFIYESDLWILDLTTGQVRNLTDDNIEGAWFSLDNREDITLDYLPLWHPDDQSLYYFSTRDLPDQLSLKLKRVAVTGGEPELLLDLTRQLPVFSIFRQTAISPDGTQLAAIVIGRESDDPLNGIWVIDLPAANWLFGSNQAAAHQVATLEDLQTGQPEWYRDERKALAPETITWGENALIVTTFDDQTVLPHHGQNMLYIDLATGTITPLADLTDVAGPANLFDIDANGQEIIQRIPRRGFVTADRTAYIYLHYGINLNDNSLALVPLPFTGQPPIELGSIADFNIRPPTIQSSGGKRAILYGQLITLDRAQ